MKGRIELLIIKYNLKGKIFEILFFPIISIFSNTKTFILTIRNITKSFPKISKFRMFSEECALNYYWYDTLAYNLNKHGRFGYSKTTLINKYLVGNWFHISRLSIFPFWKSNVLTVLIPWIILPIIFCFLFPISPLYWGVIVSYLTYIGSNYFSQLKFQNYNILGWIIFPFLFWSFENQNQYIISLIILLLFLTSFTAFVVSHGYLFVNILTTNSSLFDFLIIIFFSTILICLRIFPILIKGNLKVQFIKIGNTIGLFKTKDITYKRDSTKKNQYIYAWMKIVNAIIFLLIMHLTTENIPYLLWLTVCYLIVNSLLARFADPQTIDILIIISSFFYMIQSEGVLILIAYWILIANPIPKLYKINSRNDLLNLEVLFPYDAEALIKKLNKFFTHIKDNKVFISFEDPLNDYNKIFYGQRALIEIAHFHATLKNILLYPNLWTVLHDDSQKPENIWTRDPNKISDKMKSLSTNFLIYYTKENEKIPEYLSKNFDILETINWEIFLNDLLIETNNKFLRWHLLKKIS